MPILALLGAALVLLKVLGYITLTWLWVLAPFWVGLVGLAVALVLGGGFLAVCAFFSR